MPCKKSRRPAGHPDAKLIALGKKFESALSLDQADDAGLNLLTEIEDQIWKSRAKTLAALQVKARVAAQELGVVHDEESSERVMLRHLCQSVMRAG